MIHQHFRQVHRGDRQTVRGQQHEAERLLPDLLRRLVRAGDQANRAQARFTVGLGEERGVHARRANQFRQPAWGEHVPGQVGEACVERVLPVGVGFADEAAPGTCSALRTNEMGTHVPGKPSASHMAPSGTR